MGTRAAKREGEMRKPSALLGALLVLLILPVGVGRRRPR